jgi:hypothetical protein
MKSPSQDNVAQLRGGAKPAVDSTGGDGHTPLDGFGERLARLEGAFEEALNGIRHGQNLLLGVMGIGFALVIAVLVYVVQRLDNLPNDFERINQTISGAITAAKQIPPQTIVVPMTIQPQNQKQEPLPPKHPQ